MRMITRLEIRGYKGVGFGSCFIKWFTFALRGVTHVSAVFYFSDGSAEEIESIQGRGVIAHTPTRGKPYESRILPCTEQEAWEGYMLMRSILGAKYDWKGIFGFIRRKVCHSFDKFFCSEFVAYMAYKIGHPLSRRQPFQETPQSVMDSKVLV